MQLNPSKIFRQENPAAEQSDKLYDKIVKALEATKKLDLRTGINFYEEIRQYEAALIIRSLQLTAGSQKKAAQLLGLLPTTLNEKMKRYRIASDEN